MIRVHRIPFSTNVERVALAAARKGMQIDWVDHDPADRSAVLELSGQELVPVAEFGTDVVRGSLRIVARLEVLQPEPRLYPTDPARAARARIFTAWFDRVWKGPPNALHDQTPADAEALRLRTREWTAWIADLLSDGSAYLDGESLGIADVCAFPFLKYATIDPDPADEDSFHPHLADLLRQDEHPRLSEWIARVDAHPRA
ncbi:MAG: glutathione S-transferase family protein [Solirubrobacterales bacterium]